MGWAGSTYIWKQKIFLGAISLDLLRCCWAGAVAADAGLLR